MIRLFYAFCRCTPLDYGVLPADQFSYSAWLVHCWVVSSVSGSLQFSRGVLQPVACLAGCA